MDAEGVKTVSLRWDRHRQGRCGSSKLQVSIGRATDQEGHDEIRCTLCSGTRQRSATTGKCECTEICVRLPQSGRGEGQASLASVLRADPERTWFCPKVSATPLCVFTWNEIFDCSFKVTTSWWRQEEKCIGSVLFSKYDGQCTEKSDSDGNTAMGASFLNRVIGWDPTSGRTVLEADTMHVAMVKDFTGHSRCAWSICLCTASRFRSIQYVEMDQNHGWSAVEADGYITEVSPRRKQSMYTETVAPQSEISSTERLAADVAFATRSKTKAPPEIIAEPNSPPVQLPPPCLTGNDKSSSHCRCLVPNPAVRNSTFEQTTSPKPKETPIKAVPMKGFPVKSMSYKQAFSVKAPPEVPDVVPREKIENGYIFSVWINSLEDVDAHFQRIRRDCQLDF